jgi:putative flavoprotein involved in K+ transport
MEEIRQTNQESIYDAIIIGAGQAGLATGYYLKQQGLRFLILEQAAVPGYSWRTRYDSLVLFTPSQYSSLPGLPFLLPKDVCPNKQQIADYLAQYARFHELPLVSWQRVVRLSRADHLFITEVRDADDQTCFYRTRQVVVAIGSSQHAYVPEFSTQPDPSVFQVHSSRYTNPSLLPDGDVLVVGAGNSGALLAVELARSASGLPREIYLSANAPLDFKPLFLLGKSVFWWGEKTGLLNLSVESWLGSHLKKKPQGIYCDDLKQLIRGKKVLVVSAIEGFEGRQVVFQNGFRKAFSAIVWATGYRSNYRWIDIPGSLEENGMPRHREGISPVPGLYFMGLVWQRASTSALIQGAARDAAFIVRHMVKQPVRNSR